MSLSPRVENLKVKKVIKVSYCFVIPMHTNVSRISIFHVFVFGYVTMFLHRNGQNKS